MEENRYFREALAGFTTEVAYAGAVRHLHNLGYSAEEIRKQIAWPVSTEKIRKVIEEYERAKNSPEAEYTYIQETDSLGRKSFRKVKKNEGKEKYDV